MNLSRFMAQGGPVWKDLELLLVKLRNGSTLKAEEVRQISDLYRKTAADYAYAYTYFRDMEIRTYLQKLVTEAHNLIYSRPRTGIGDFRRWLTGHLAAICYANRWAFFFSMLIFVGFTCTGFLGSEWIKNGERIFLNASILDPQGSVYASETYIKDRETDIANGKPFEIYNNENRQILTSSLIMFNNIYVSMMCVAGGFFGGIMTFYMLAYTGMMVGAFFHIYYRHGIIFEFWNTIMLHGGLELTSVVIAGMCGFMIARGMLFPGMYTRSEQMIRMGGAVIQILFVVTFFLIQAGIIEGNVTGMELPSWGKLLINAVLFSQVFLLAFQGWRKREMGMMAEYNLDEDKYRYLKKTKKVSGQS